MKSHSLVLLSLLVLGACNDTPPRDRGESSEPRRDSITPTTGPLSQLARVRGSAQLTTTAELAQARSLPVGFSDVPRLEESDDGRGDSPLVRAIRPALECGSGSAFTGLRARIADCAEKNPQHFQWNGAELGIAGEGRWRLVLRDATGREVWQDVGTGYVWSDVLSSTHNWCQASGNDESALLAGGIDCNELRGGVSRCEGASLHGIPASEMSWRLPTRGDYLQADLNGLRAVLPRLDQAHWTATVNGANREHAWSITPALGVLTSAPRSQPLSVRCLGRALK